MAGTRIQGNGRLEPPEGATAWLDPAAFGDASRGPLLDVLKPALHSLDDRLAREFWDGAPVEKLVVIRAWAVEQLLLVAWRETLPGDAPAALVAVGGFGRGELHPHSDVDLMILLGQEPPDAELKAAIETFLALLWDAGMYLGHSVRTPAQCVEEAGGDVVTATNLMESRLLDGPADLFAAMREATAPERMWAGPAFFEAKFREQHERHERFNETAYNLEPNIKEGPGGLRDIQMVSWVCKRHLGADSLHGLVDHGFLTEKEYTDLHQGRLFLWRVRFALHLLAGRAEDRLLFDYQRQIASRLGYTRPGDDANATVEAFMQHYYRVVMQLERLNESLLQLFREELLDEEDVPADDIGEDFYVQKGFLGIHDESLFERRPEALIRIFVLLASHPRVRGVRASAIRKIRNYVHHIDEGFGRRPEVLAAFYELLCQPSGIYTQLQRMNRYGVLAALLPSFAHITGRMHFDLFHVFTVDQHILFVVRNLRRFAYGKYAEVFPYMEEEFQLIEKPQLLYLAAIFHDIAKGRGGDHSDLGALEARDFCKMLPVSGDEGELVAWLVQHHLLMSQTAQRRDITDPEVVDQFAQQVKGRRHLQHLYLLTVADIAATSPKLWNHWKSGLLRELYLATLEVLERGAGARVDREVELAGARERAMGALLDEGCARADVLKVWQWLPSSAFQRFSTGQMAWSTRQLLRRERENEVVVAIRQRPRLSISEVLVSAPDYTGLVAATTTVFDEMGLNVLSARVLTARNERSFDLFQVMDAHGKPLNEQDGQHLVARLEALLGAKQRVEPVRRAMPRRLRPFVSPPKIRFDTARGGTVTSLDLECTDRPGLLSQLAGAMVACGIRIHDAKIATFGDRAEDTFLVTDRSNRLLSRELQAELVAEIHRRLEITGG